MPVEALLLGKLGVLHLSCGLPGSSGAVVSNICHFCNFWSKTDWIDDGVFSQVSMRNKSRLRACSHLCSTQCPEDVTLHMANLIRQDTSPSNLAFVKL